MPADPDSQFELFRSAVDLLGGQRAAARALDCNERTMRALYAGERLLHDGWLRDMAVALARHAQACRDAERRITPAFHDNLTVRQQTLETRNDTRRFDRERNT